MKLVIGQSNFKEMEKQKNLIGCSSIPLNLNLKEMEVPVIDRKSAMLGIYLAAQRLWPGFLLATCDSSTTPLYSKHPRGHRKRVLRFHLSDKQASTHS